MGGENVIKKPHCTTATGLGDLSDSDGVNTTIVILNYRLQFKGSRTHSWESEAPDKRAKAPPGWKRACSATVPLNLTRLLSTSSTKPGREVFSARKVK